MNRTAFGLIYTGENNPKMRDLTASRAVAALPFGGRYRCIDFILSNLVHTGISSVGLIAQKNYHSLMDHLGAGKEWDLHRKREGLFILPPFLTKDSTEPYHGSIDAFYGCLGYVRRSPCQYIIVSGSHTIFNTDFTAMMEQHINTRADITIMYNEDPFFDPEDQNKDLRLYLDGDGRVTSMEYDPYRPGSNNQSCDVFIMDKALFEHLINDAHARGETHFIRDLLMKKCSALRIYGWRYNGVVKRLNSVASYFSANMSLLDPAIRNDLFNPRTPIYTKVKDEVSARYGAEASVTNSMLADGCEVYGSVENCILFRGVTIGKGSVVKDSILLQGTSIGENVRLDHVIMDKGVTVRDGRALAGYDGFPMVIRKNATV